MSRVLISDVVEVVAEWFSLSPDNLIAHGRQRHIVWPRHLAIFLSRELAKQSMSGVGRYFEGRDHSTITRAVNLVRRELAAEPQLAIAVDNLAEAIRERAASRFCALAVLREHVHGRTREAAHHG